MRNLNVYQETREAILWSVDKALHVGQFVLLSVLESAGRDEMVRCLREQEPRSRAETAFKAASRALSKPVKDENLAQFELLRAGVALKDTGERDPVYVQETAAAVIRMAVEDLPNTGSNARIAEQVTRESLEVIVDMINSEEPSISAQPQENLGPNPNA